MTTDRPLLRVVNGSPTAEELAVVTAVVTAVASAGSAREVERTSRGAWNDPARGFRRQLVPGPNAWRAAFR